MKRRDSRERAMQAMFSMDFEKKSLDGLRSSHSSLDELSAEDEFCWELVKSTLENLEALDKSIEASLKNWKLSRLNGVDRACLRLGACEILIEGTQKAVVINEYIEIARRFSDTDSAAFINGILDVVKKS